jgi:hypothetical protein
MSQLKRFLENPVRVAREKALEQLTLASFPKPEEKDPIVALHHLPWEPFCSKQIADDGYATLNLTLDPYGCLGRMALAGAYVETHFTNVRTIEAGDVINDWFWNMLWPERIQKINMFDDYLPELVSYEDPHGVLIVNKVQFEPLSCMMGSEIVHPKVQPYPLWNMVAGSMLCAHASAEKDLGLRQELLVKAESCAKTIETYFQRISLAVLQDKEDEAVAYSEALIKLKPSARAMWGVYMMANGRYKEELIKNYTEKIFTLFEV